MVVELLAIRRLTAHKKNLDIKRRRNSMENVTIVERRGIRRMIAGNSRKGTMTSK